MKKRNLPKRERKVEELRRKSITRLNELRYELRIKVRRSGHAFVKGLI